jgi:hypothetical protein
MTEKATAPSKREGRPFYLVQRLRLSPFKRHEEAFPQAKVKSNPFGYGRMGDYELDYMGSAEFEWGAIPEANNRLAKAGKDLALEEFEYQGHTFDFLWIGKEGEPFAEWVDWVEGRAHDRYTDRTYEAAPCEGKERPYELLERLGGATKPRYGDDWCTAIWWALTGNVLWAFKEDGHLTRWIESMGTAPTEFLR